MMGAWFRMPIGGPIVEAAMVGASSWFWLGVIFRYFYLSQEVYPNHFRNPHFTSGFSIGSGNKLCTSKPFSQTLI